MASSTNELGSIATLNRTTGSATISGAGSSWINSGGLRVGQGGNATLLIDSGGRVENSFGTINASSSSTSVATVSGVGSEWVNSTAMSVGSLGTGTLNIESGGFVSSTSGRIGSQVGSTGIAAVSGGSMWENSGSLFVGSNGQGTLTIDSGGVVTNTEGRIASCATATGVVSVSDASRWTSTGELTVGFSGDGTLTIDSAGIVSNTDDAFIARNSSSESIATVTGAGSQWNNSQSLFIGGSDSAAGGTGTLNIESEALVTVASTLKLWDDGTLNLSGGRLDAQTIDLAAATATADFNMTGGLLVVDSILGSFEQNGGTLAPGDTLEMSGLTDIANNFDLTAGIVEFEIGGLLRESQFDAIDVGGIATLNGTIDVNLIDGFSGSRGNSFLLFDATDGISGTPTFDFSDASLSGPLFWDTSQFLSTGTIVIQSSVPEPNSLVGFVLAGSGLLFQRRRRR